MKNFTIELLTVPYPSHYTSEPRHCKRDVTSVESASSEDCIHWVAERLCDDIEMSRDKKYEAIEDYFQLAESELSSSTFVPRYIGCGPRGDTYLSVTKIDQ